MHFNYAQLNENNIVIGVSQLSGEISDDNYISISEYTETILGKKWNGEFFESLPYTQKPILILYPLEFLRRFSAQERILIKSSSDPIINDFLYLLEKAQYIRLDDSDTIDGVNYLEQNGFLANGRAQEILTPNMV